MTTAAAAVIVEPLLKPATSVAHVVRTTFVSLLAAAAISLACLQAFTLAYGVENRPLDGLPHTPSAGLPSIASCWSSSLSV